MPPEFERNAESWLRVNPGWQMRTWRIEDLGWLRNLRYVVTAAEWTPARYVPRFMSNLARYEILHKCGGVYVDCDTEALSPIEPHIEGLAAFAGQERPRQVGNSVLGAEPGNPFWAEVIERAPVSIRAHRGERSPVSCGPVFLQSVADEVPGLAVLPRQLFYPLHWSQLGQSVDMSGAVCRHDWAALRGQVSVIVPWRDCGCSHRRAAWRWVSARLAVEHPDWQVVPASDGGDGAWSRARAIRNGLTNAFGDVLVVSDADVWCDALPAAVQAVREGAPWAVPHSRVQRLTQDATRRLMAGDRSEPEFDERPYVGTLTGGLVVLKREVLEQVPPDPRFVGWGHEDEAWGIALRTLVGEPWRGTAALTHLWHPPQQRISRDMGNVDSVRLRNQYRAAAGTPKAMRALVAQMDQRELDVDLFRCKRTYLTRVDGRQVRIRKDEVRPADDPAVLKSPHRWQPVPVRDAPLRRAVEQATAAPGERRELVLLVCDEPGCDATAKSPAGLAAHKRSHSRG